MHMLRQPTVARMATLSALIRAYRFRHRQSGQPIALCSFFQAAGDCFGDLPSNPLCSRVGGRVGPDQATSHEMDDR